MKPQNTLTVIISRNYGHPISLSLPVWRVYFGGMLLVLVLTGMALMSVLFLATYPRVRVLEQQRDALKSERDALRSQLLSANQQAFDLKDAGTALNGEREAARIGAYVARASTSGSASDYLPPVEITSVKTKVDRTTVEIVFRITAQGDPVRNRGGFLFAIFENVDLRPVKFVASPTVNLNAEGFPATYKSGVRFSRVRKSVTYRRKVRRRSQDEYFTHVTLYLFSLRGGLLVKDRFELEREIFNKVAAGTGFPQARSI
ncbi:MAG: hypothetical protein O7E56_07105 [SAR324 cluster bacterium]|nr:hypothetical protein [SAR324 cluster bacterium]MCZ6558064.1 hypothetical protein [SAR324 cluster bacterium]MCZ6627982.1 hypothetical protein [SAR324 cluster bacterium]MCZ6645326.1 hypothetical protein [SAR324 cluster bacterium]